MPVCRKCQTWFKTCLLIDGKLRNVSKRKFCLVCSPFGLHNTRKLDLPARVGKRNDWRKYREKHNAHVKVVRRQRKLELIRLKGGACQRCGYNKCLAALDFHHRAAATKTFSLSCANISGHTWAAVVAEAEKTDLLCRNCHAEEHWME